MVVTRTKPHLTVIPQDTITLITEWEGTQIAGATVVCAKEPSIGVLLSIQRGLTSGEVDQLERAFAMFGDEVLVEWTLADASGALPPTAEGVLRLPPSIAGLIIEQWSESLSIPKASNTPSANGSTSPAASMPAETL